MIRRQGDRGASNGTRIRHPPKRLFRHLPGDGCATFYHRALSDANTRQNQTVGTDKYIVLDDHVLVSALRLSWPPIKMGNDGGPQADGDVIADNDPFRMQFIEIHVLADPYILANGRSSTALQHRTYRETAGRNEANFIYQSPNHV